MSFENLRVYIAAERLEGAVQELLPRIPAKRESDAKQLGRCVTSTPYNIAEACGVGRPGFEGRKIYHLEIARGSADETRSILNVLTTAGIFKESETKPLQILARTIAKMLTSWINKLRGTEPPS